MGPSSPYSAANWPVDRETDVKAELALSTTNFFSQLWSTVDCASTGVALSLPTVISSSAPSQAWSLFDELDLMRTCISAKYDLVKWLVPLFKGNPDWDHRWFELLIRFYSRFCVRSWFSCLIWNSLDLSSKKSYCSSKKVHWMNIFNLQSTLSAISYTFLSSDNTHSS